MSDNNSRMIYDREYPRTIYAQMLVVFFGANLMYHKHVFRMNGNRPQFFMFMLANAFTSFQIAEMTNLTVLDREAAAFNNTEEMIHRSKINERLRLNMMKTRMF